MTDIAALIERLRKWPWPDCPLPSEAVADMHEAAAALRSLAQEVERLTIQRTSDDEIDDIRQDELDRSLERIRELEAERDRETERAEVAIESLNECRDERDAIRTKTIEECAQAADRESDAIDGGEYWIAARIAKRIRALATVSAPDLPERPSDTSSDEN